MKISELIDKLEKMRTDYGDVRVEARNGAGDWDYVNEVAYTNIGIPSDPEWVVFIDI